jgi:tetratricopeptide (TPR) repeat protein
MNLVLNQNYEFGIRSLKKALEIDSTFALAYFYITYAYSYYQGNSPEVKIWIKKAYLHKDRVPPKYQLWIELWHLCEYSKDIDNITRCCDLLSESGINTRLFWYDIGVTYADFPRQYDKAVNAFEKVMAISQVRGSDWKDVIFWERFQMALHKTGNHEREKEISNMGLKLLPDKSNWFYYYMAQCALSQGNASDANEYLIKYLAKHKELGTPESIIELYLGNMHEEANVMDQAEIHYRKACEIDPQNTNLLMTLASFLINTEINVNEGLDLIYKVRVINPKITAYHYEGWALYKLGRYEEAAELIEKAWGRMTGFNIEVYRHLEAAKKAAAGQKN